MTALVVEEALARLVADAPGRPLVAVPRRRARRRWSDLAPDAVAEALAGAGAGAVVLARPPTADPGAAGLPALGRLMGHPVVRLPAGDVAAAWCVAIACHPDLDDADLVRRLEALAGALADDGRPRGGSAVPTLRPRALSRWAGRAWRPCARCPGGGPPEGVCGRCGAHGPGAQS